MKNWKRKINQTLALNLNPKIPKSPKPKTLNEKIEGENINQTLTLNPN
jgi:hypothetical protein